MIFFYLFVAVCEKCLNKEEKENKAKDNNKKKLFNIHLLFVMCISISVWPQYPEHISKYLHSCLTWPLHILWGLC